METRRIGTLEVSVVGLGCNNFGMAIDADATRAVVDAAIEAGINYFDTAESYGNGQSEEYLGRALAGRRDQVLVATKWGFVAKPDAGERQGRPEHVRASLDASLQRLGMDHVDHYQLHRPDPDTPIAETLGVLDELRTAGKIREIGCTGFSAAHLAEAAEAGAQAGIASFPSVQNHYSLLTRTPETDGVLELYQAGSEGPQWWLPHPDPVRGGRTSGILERCRASGTCPKIVEHFGSAEVWALKLTPEWVGTDGQADLPLPDDVRRYYLASTNHGGGAGGFDSSLPGVGLPRAGPACPGNNFGTGVLPANPVPHLQTVNALSEHFRRWVVDGTPPPPSRYPTLAAGTLAPAHKAAIGFPTLPGLRASVPEPDFIMPVLDYDWGPGFDPVDGSGVPSAGVPRVRRVLPMFAPRVDADGNELGGVPIVLLDAPLGTYLGWNVTAGGDKPFHAGQICNYVGGMIPFARTAAERRARDDPRPSLEERYGTHDGYVAAVERAAERARREGFLLPADARALVDAARASAVLE